MKKNTQLLGLTALVAVIVLGFAALSLTGCDDGTTAHKHQWGEWMGTATCTEAGTETRVCKLNATHIETREQPALGHDWEEQPTTIPATETQNGGTGIFCKRDRSHLQEGGIVEWATGSAGLTFSVAPNGGLYVHKGEFTGTTLHIPAYHRPDVNSEYKLVTTTGLGAFKDCTNITAVTFAAESQLTTIGAEVFSGCSGITSIVLPAGITSIGETAFNDCTSLTSVTIPASVTEIGRYAFYGCSSLTSIDLPAGITEIAAGTFYDCSGITSIVLPTSLTTIGGGAFYNCSSLTSIDLPAGITEIGDSTFNGCTSLASVTLPTSLTTIGGGAFNNCTSLASSITIPASVTSIGFGAFNGCSSLTSITVDAGNSNFSVQDGILYSTTAIVFVPRTISGSITVRNGITAIGDNLFSGCRDMTSITLPASLTTIGDGAFFGCHGLTSITIGAGVTSIGNNAFAGCSSLASMTVDPNNPNYTSEGGILYNKAKTEIIFVPAGLNSLVLPEGMTTVNALLLANSPDITSITIPASVTEIADGAFTNCAKLASITVNANNPNYASEDNILYTKAKTAILFVPRAISGAVTIPNSVTTIGAGAFMNCRNMTSITIPASVTDIAGNAFTNCPGLTTITVDASNPNYASDNNILYNKGKTALLFVPAATSGVFTIPASVTTIGDGAFMGCTKITSITIPATVTAIGDSPFAFWTAEQTINVAGHANQAAADAAWLYNGNPSFWRAGCNATIKYQGEF